MKKEPKYIFNCKRFKNYSELKESVKGTLYIGRVNSKLDSTELDFILYYFSKIHPRWHMKNGQDVAVVRRIKSCCDGKRRAFQILRKDGSVISIKKF